MTEKEADIQELQQYRQIYRRDIRKKPLTQLLAEQERFEQLLQANPEAFDPGDEMVLQELMDQINTLQDKLIRDARGDCPIAFYVPTWEQAQMMNAWSPEFDPIEAPEGYQSVCNFGGMRSNKTFATIMAAVLCVVPNVHDWPIFQEHEDWMGRGKYRIFRRPLWDYFQRTSRMVFSDEEPPLVGKNIWHGAVDEDHWKNKLDRNYRRVMPMKYIKHDGKVDKWNLQDRYFETKWDTRVSGKLYNSDIQSWSGEELAMTIFDEGPPLDKLEEVIMRSRSIMWAYTPREAANTAERSAVARSVYYGERRLVGKVKFIFSKTLDTPEYIMDAKTKAIRKMNADSMGELGKVSLEGGWYDSSPTVFNAFKRDLHVLPINGLDVLDAINGKTIPDRLGMKMDWMEKFKGANILRGFDEGLAHPTGCLFAAILRSGEYVIFKEYLESDTSIPERCQKIIGISGNEREPIFADRDRMTEEQMELARQYAPDILKDRQREAATGLKVRRYREKMKGMFIRKTFADSKIFRRDPMHKLDSWVDNYAREGLKLERASNALPEARADYVNGMFRPDMSREHLNPHQRTPDNPYGYRLYVTHDCIKTITCLERYLWEQKTTGPYKGEPTGKPDRRADEIPDCLGYICLSKLRWVDPEELKSRRMVSV